MCFPTKFNPISSRLERSASMPIISTTGKTFNPINVKQGKVPFKHQNSTDPARSPTAPSAAPNNQPKVALSEYEAKKWVSEIAREGMVKILNDIDSSGSLSKNFLAKLKEIDTTDKIDYVQRDIIERHLNAIFLNIVNSTYTKKDMKKDVQEFVKELSNAKTKKIYSDLMGTSNTDFIKTTNKISKKTVEERTNETKGIMTKEDKNSFAAQQFLSGFIAKIINPKRAERIEASLNVTLTKEQRENPEFLYGKPVATLIKLLTEEFMLCERLDADKVITFLTVLGGKLLTLEYMEHPLASGSVEAGTNTDDSVDSVDGDEVSSDPSSTTNSIPPFLLFPEVPPHDPADNIGSDDDTSSDDEPDAKVKKEKGNETPEVGGSSKPRPAEVPVPKSKKPKNLLVPSETAVVEERGAPEVKIDKNVKPVDEEVSDTKDTTPKSVPKVGGKWAEVKIPDKPLITTYGSANGIYAQLSPSPAPRVVTTTQSLDKVPESVSEIKKGGVIEREGYERHWDGNIKRFLWTKINNKPKPKPLITASGSSSSFAHSRLNPEQSNKPLPVYSEYTREDKTWVKHNERSQPKVDS